MSSPSGWACHDGADNASFDEQAIEALKFHECLPPALQQEVLRERMVRREVLDSVLSGRTTPVYVSA